jgi:predicted site-specific integrase-resolvase
MKRYSIGEFANLIGITPQTLRSWHKQGKLVPDYISDGGTRYYSADQRDQYLGVKGRKKPRRSVVGYARVSSPQSRPQLEEQVRDLRNYMCAKGYQFEMIKDIGVSFSLERPGIKRLLAMMLDDRVERIVIINRERLFATRSEVIMMICEKYDIEIEVIDQTTLAVAESVELAEYRKETITDLVLTLAKFVNKLPPVAAFPTRHLLETLRNIERQSLFELVPEQLTPTDDLKNKKITLPSDSKLLVR